VISECEGWEGCITFDNMGKLAAYLMQVDTWMKDAWAGCQAKER
jgi:hypothetical protein